jgi:hypothetical protein
MSVCKHQVLTVALQHLLVPSVVGWSIGEVEERQNELLNIIEARQLCQQNGTKGSVVASKGNIVMAKLKETSKNIMEDFNNVDCQEWLSPFQQVRFFLQNDDYKKFCFYLPNLVCCFISIYFIIICFTFIFSNLICFLSIY